MMGVSFWHEHQMDELSYINDFIKQPIKLSNIITQYRFTVKINVVIVWNQSVYLIWQYAVWVEHYRQDISLSDEALCALTDHFTTQMYHERYTW